MNPIVEKVYQIGIIPVIAFNSVDEALPLCKALAEGGLPAAEVTFRTACAEECIRKIHDEMPEMLLGAGTVLTTEQADRAMAAGASFIVAPGFDPEVCKHVIDKGGIMMPGTASAGEMQQAMNLGCEALKFFPAEANGGVNMLKNIGAALKGARWMCTGGVNAKNVNDYLGYDQIFAVGGTWMCKSDVIKAGDWAKITAQSKEAVDTMLGLKLMHVGINTGNEEEAMKVANLIGRSAEHEGRSRQLQHLRRQQGVRDHEEARPRHQWPHRHRLQQRGPRHLSPDPARREVRPGLQERQERQDRRLLLRRRDRRLRLPPRSGLSISFCHAPPHRSSLRRADIRTNKKGEYHNESRYFWRTDGPSAAVQL